MFSQVYVCPRGRVSLVPGPFWGVWYLWSHVPSGVRYLEVGYLGGIRTPPQCGLLWHLVCILLGCFLVENALKLSLGPIHAKQKARKSREKR